MSEQATTGPIGNVDVSESPGVSLPKLAELARQAYELKRTKNCLDLTRAILLIDPENAEAQLMRSSIRSEMHLDLENARALLRDAHLKDKPERHSQAGNTILRKVLPDPDCEEAPVPVLQADPSPLADPPPTIKQPSMTPMFKGFLNAPVRTEERLWLKGLKRASVIIFVGLVVGSLPTVRSRTNPVDVPLSLGAASGGSVKILDVDKDNLVKAAGYDQYHETSRTDSLQLASALAGSNALITDSGLNAPPPFTDSASGTPRQALRQRDETIILAPSGTLAVSSPSSTEIYIDDQHIGSTPVSLQMSAGTHTVEYRHGGMRQALTHIIKSNETTRAMITFDVEVTINSKPWADVFLDGIERKPLGQTPLSGVRVPIGGVLVFENPNFQAKRHRVTGSDTGIQIVFP